MSQISTLNVSDYTSGGQLQWIIYIYLMCSTKTYHSKCLILITISFTNYVSVNCHNYSELSKV